MVLNDGQSLLGVVYDPVEQKMYKAVRGRGVTINEKAFQSLPMNPLSSSDTWTWFADRSLKKHRYYERYRANFSIRFVGGAVMNSLQLLNTPKSVYLKAPKSSLGGCAIWDLAAVSLILRNAKPRFTFTMVKPFI